MTEELLLKRIADYREKETEETLHDAETALASFLYINLARYRLDSSDEDIKSDFIVWLYPKLGKIISQYDSARSSFKTYLGWIIKLSYRTFRRCRYSSDARQKVLECEEATRIISAEAESPYPVSVPAETAEIKPIKTTKPVKRSNSAFARKVFLLACKSSAFLDESAIFRVISLTGYEEGYVRSRLEYIRRSCLDKQERMRSTREKQYAYYIRAQQCRYEMKYLEHESKRYVDLEREYRYCTKRLEAVRKIAERHIQGPSNRFLARTLGMCRGTVDSTLASAGRDGYSDVS